MDPGTRAIHLTNLQRLLWSTAEESFGLLVSCLIVTICGSILIIVAAQQFLACGSP